MSIIAAESRVIEPKVDSRSCESWRCGSWLRLAMGKSPGVQVCTVERPPNVQSELGVERHFQPRHGVEPKGPGLRSWEASQCTIGARGDVERCFQPDNPTVAMCMS